MGTSSIQTAPAAIHLYVDNPMRLRPRLQAGASPSTPTDDHLQATAGAPSKIHLAITGHRRAEGWTPGSEGLRSVQPYLHLREAHKMFRSGGGVRAEAMGCTNRRRARAPRDDSNRERDAGD